MTNAKFLILAGLLGIGIVAGLAQAQSGAVSGALADGSVGEKADGYLGIRGSVSAAVRGEVESINIKRRAVYTDLAAKRGVSVEAMAAATACKTLPALAVGRAFQLDGGAWQVRGGGDPAPKPGNCPG